jgi:hypothetical protein
VKYKRMASFLPNKTTPLHGPFYDLHATFNNFEEIISFLNEFEPPLK